MLRRWADARDAVVIAVLHDLNLAARYADHVVAMNAGQVVAQGPVDKVFSQNVLAEAYQVDFHFSTHPQDGRPVVVGPVLDAYTTTTHAGVAP
jgi:iron complex transport system ATP-binding protein